MVRNGGRSKESHIARIKLKKIANPMPVAVYTNHVRFPFHAATAPVTQPITANKEK